LLHYGRWMAEHEYPYLDRPEKLQYPNETWAAQDLRKAVVLRSAARAAGPDEGTRLIKRASFFSEDALARLTALPTTQLTRPMVLLLSLALAPVGGTPFPEGAPIVAGEPASFRHQRSVAERRALVLGVIAAGCAAALLTWAAWRS